MTDQRFNLSDYFTFDAGDYIETAFLNRLEEQGVPYHLREGISFNAFPQRFYHVKESDLEAAKIILQNVRHDSLLNSDMNLIKRFKSISVSYQDLPDKISYQYRPIHYFQGLALSTGMLGFLLLAFWKNSSLALLPAATIVVYFFLRVFAGQSVRSLVLTKSHLRLDQELVDWKDIVYVDNIDESLKFKRYIITLTTSKGKKFRIDPAKFNVEAGALCTRLGHYYAAAYTEWKEIAPNN